MSGEIVRRIRRRQDGIVQIVAGPPPKPVDQRLGTVIALTAGTGAVMLGIVAWLLKLAPLGPLVFWA